MRRAAGGAEMRVGQAGTMWRKVPARATRTHDTRQVADRPPVGHEEYASAKRAGAD